VGGSTAVGIAAVVIWYDLGDALGAVDTGPVRNWDLDAEGLQEELLKRPHPGLPDPKTVGVKPIPKLPQVTIGGFKETVVSPGSAMPAVHGRVAGLLNPMPK
jgi:hypothetical protein